MEVEGPKSITEPVVNGERCKNQRAERAIGGEDAGGLHVGKEAGNAVEASDVGVLDDGMGIVEMELVAEVIRVDESDECQKSRDRDEGPLPGHRRVFPEARRA